MNDRKKNDTRLICRSLSVFVAPIALLIGCRPMRMVQGTDLVVAASGALAFDDHRDSVGRPIRQASAADILPVSGR
jgi:hypothetical protein